jgi:hypothetical protein
MLHNKFTWLNGCDKRFISMYVYPGAELGGGRRGFIPGRTILEGVIFVIINN